MIYRSFDKAQGEGRDAIKLAETFVYAHQSQISWNESILAYGGGVDFFTGTLAFLISRITGDPIWFFFGLSVFMGIFIVKNLWYILDRLHNRMDLASILLLSLFLLISPIWKIDTGRWAIALQVFIWGMLPYMYENKKRHLWWAYSSVLIHFSFFVPALLLTAFLFLSKRNISFFFWLFIVLAFFRQIDLSFIRQVLEFVMPEYMIDRIGYVGDEYVQKRILHKEESSFFLRYFNDMYRWVLIIISSVIYLEIKKNNLILSKTMLKAFSISLFFTGFAFLFSQIPVGSRYLLIGYSLMLSFYLLLLNQTQKLSLRRAVIYTSPLTIFLLIIKIRMALNYFNLVSIFGNFIIAAFLRLDVPISEYILDFF